MESNDRELFENIIFQTILDQLCTNIYVTDIETDQIVYMNEAMKQTFKLDDPVGKVCWKVFQEGMEERCGFCRISRLLQMSGEKVCVWDEENTLNHRIYKNYDSLIKWDGKTYHMQNSMDVTEYTLLSESASRDELTKVYNRRAGSERLEEMLDRARKEDKVLSVVLYDVNELKKINDKYGHSEGDRLLSYISTTCKNALRVPDFMFRLSGDEFVIVFYDENPEDAEERMKCILKRLRDDREVHSIFYEVSFSYGLIEIYPGEHYTVKEVLAKVDEQMYVQKRGFHIKRAKQELLNLQTPRIEISRFEYDKDHLYDALTAGTDDYIFVGNMKTGVFRYPPDMVEEFGLPGQIVKNAAAFWGEIIHPQDADYFLESNQEIADGRVEYHNIEYRAKNVKGEWVWLKCRGKMIPDEQGRPTLFAGMISNLGKKKQIDHMTGLYNRFEFEGAIKKYLAANDNVTQMGVMILDMDSFHNINDLYDRFFGDEVLRITAHKIESMLPTNAKIYRLDGDEFGVVILNGGKEECLSIYGQIQNTFRRQQEYSGRKYYCSLSAGCTFYPQDTDNYLNLLKYANYSLETSKHDGKNRITIFSSAILQQKERKLELTELLRESVERGFAGFSISYQAQVDSVTRKLYGAEALARWKCAKYGQISPVEFIPLLEQSGLIIKFGAWIFQQAVRQCKEWTKIKPGFHISINLSYLQLLEGDIVYFIQRTLNDLELDPSNVTMELTETYLAKEDTAIQSIIRRMQELGIHIAMDDFGVGYSSLHSLKSTPVDLVKIDRGFVKGITENTFNATFIRSIAELCHNVGKKVCLEGVETQEEYDTVSDMGLELIQGYFFGYPITAEMFEKKFF